MKVKMNGFLWVILVACVSRVSFLGYYVIKEHSLIEAAENLSDIRQLHSVSEISPSTTKIFNPDAVSRYLYHAISLVRTGEYGYSYTSKPSSIASFSAPGYSLLLSCIFFVFGIKVLPVLVIQTAAAILCIWLTMRISTILAGNLVAIVAGILMTLNWYIALPAVQFQTEGWAMLLALMYWYILVKSNACLEMRQVVLLGILLGIGCLFKSTFIILALLTLYPIYRSRQPLAIKRTRSVVFALLVFAPMLAWCVRNYFALGMFTYAQEGAFMLWYGNSSYAVESLLHGEWRVDYLDQAVLYSSSELIQQALTWTLSNPVEWLKVFALKVLAFWNAFSLVALTPSRIVLMIIGFAYLSIGVYSFSSSLKNQSRLFVLWIAYIVALTLVHGIVWATPRYRLPFIDAFAMIGVALFVVNMMTRLGRAKSPA